jgi:hypothetical protein
MQRIVFGIAFAQVLAMLILVLTQLAISLCFWWIVERGWQRIIEWSQTAWNRIAWTRMQAS